MLIRFTVSNFMSFKDEVEFSMVAGPTTDHADHTISIGENSDDRILKTGIVYGANAAGKSNLVKALQFAQKFIVPGAESENHIGVVPFLLDHDSKHSPSKFEFEIECKSGTFVYGFKVSNEEVHSEYLRKIEDDEEAKIYSRDADDSGSSDVKLHGFQPSDQKEERILHATIELIGPRELFLTSIAKHNVNVFKEVYDWFKYSLRIVLPDYMSSILTKSYMSDDEFEQNSREIIGLFDLGIDDILLRKIGEEESEDEAEDLRRRYAEAERDVAVHFPPLGIYLFLRADQQVHMKQLVTVHEVKSKDIRQIFNLDQESDGTRRLLNLSRALIGLLSGNEDQVLVVDEMDLRLHPHMTRNVLEIFLANSIGRRSQLVATTHESGLLDLSLLRKDEIWFIEKDQEGSSSIYSLDEFVPQFGKDIRSAYLQGRFGAIPIVPSYNVLEWAQPNG